MKNLIAIISILMISNLSLAQWSAKYVNNGFDDPYYIGVCYSKEDARTLIKLEENDGEVLFYVQGSYFCNNVELVEISLTVGGENKRYAIDHVYISKDQNAIFIDPDIMNSEMIYDFKKATTLRMRITYEYCPTDVYSFSMAGSSTCLAKIYNQ